MDVRNGCVPARGGRRKGAAAVELALLLPMLCFIALLAADYARVVPVAMTVADCARHGALFASSPDIAAPSPFASVQEAALAGAVGLDPPPVVTSTTGTDPLGRPFVEVTVSHTFRTLAAFPGIPESVPLRRTVRMPMAPN
ncbi:TadE/TadG family type IV pilus assembly protein [Tautonia sp. JC769]|uniref:TadE/TadG family type IV pilus assembly protein n=1 Tax=Tautonia sp. JC769 TaxID=3232135 RepID=UPI00345AFD45